MTFCNVNNYKSISLFFCLVLRMFLTNFHCAPSKKVIRKCQSCFQVWIGEKRIIRDHTLVRGGFAPVTLLFASGEGGSQSRSVFFRANKSVV